MHFGLIDFSLIWQNTNDKICLTIDLSAVNKDGPGRFRAKADNPEFQVCYFNSKNNK